MSLNHDTKNVRFNSPEDIEIFQKSGWDMKVNLVPFANLPEDEVIRLVNKALLGAVPKE